MRLPLFRREYLFRLFLHKILVFLIKIEQNFKHMTFLLENML